LINYIDAGSSRFSAVRQPRGRLHQYSATMGTSKTTTATLPQIEVTLA
jgi:hypothetical protein